MADNQVFWNWAESELEKRNLTWSRVERIAGLSNAAISKRARDIMKPTDETCRAIARAFGIQPDEVMRRAGLLPAALPTDTPILTELIREFVQLSDGQQKLILQQVRGLNALGRTRGSSD